MKDNCIENWHLGMLIDGFMVANWDLRLRWPITVKQNLWPQNRWFTSPNNFVTVIALFILMIPSFRTDRPGHTVLTQIRLLRKGTVKILNIRTPKNWHNYLKIWRVWLCHTVMSPRDADGMGNSPGIPVRKLGDQYGIHCLPFLLHLLDSLLFELAKLFRCYDNYGNISGVWFFRFLL